MTTVAVGTPAVRARPPYRRRRVVRAPLGPTGFFFAVSYFCAALTPSLLPRSWLSRAW